MRTNSITSSTDWHLTFNTEHGRRVLKEIYREAGLNVNVFNRDPYQTAFNNGKQCMAYYIKDKLREVKND